MGLSRLHLRSHHARASLSDFCQVLHLRGQSLLNSLALGRWKGLHHSYVLRRMQCISRITRAYDALFNVCIACYAGIL